MALTNVTGSNNSWGTEYFLVSASTTMSAQTDDTDLEGYLDVSALAAGDTYKITLYEKVNGGTARAVYPSAFLVGAQSSLYVLPRVRVMEGWDIGVICVAGTNSRTITWALRKDDTGMSLTSVVDGTRTVKGVLARQDAVNKGKATGLVGSTAAFFADDGTTKLIEAAQDVNAGTRTAASTVAGD